MLGLNKLDIRHFLEFFCILLLQLLLIKVFKSVDNQFARYFYPFSVNTGLPPISLCDLLLLSSILALFIKRTLFQKERKIYLSLLLFLFFVSLSQWQVPETQWFSFHGFYLNLFTISSLFPVLNTDFCKKRLPSFLKIFSFFLILGAVFQSTLAVLQYFNQGSLGLKFLGEMPFLDSVFPIQSGHLWIGDSLLDIAREKRIVCRGYGTFSHPNLLGGFLSVSLLITFCVYIFSKKQLIPFLQGALFVQFLAFFTTFSRSSGISWGLGALFFFIILRKILLQSKEIDSSIVNQRMKNLFWLTVLLLGFNFTVFFEPIYARGGIISYTHVSFGSDESRMSSLKVAKNMIQAHPLIGVGYKNFVPQIDHFKEGLTNYVEPLPVHNIYALIWAECGIFALLCFLSFCYFTLKNYFSLSEKNFYNTLFLFIFSAILLIGLLDCYPLTSKIGRYVLFGTSGLLFAFSSYSEKKAVVKQPWKKVPV